MISPTDILQKQTVYFYWNIIVSEKIELIKYVLVFCFLSRVICFNFLTWF